MDYYHQQLWQQQQCSVGTRGNMELVSPALKGEGGTWIACLRSSAQVSSGSTSSARSLESGDH